MTNDTEPPPPPYSVFCYLGIMTTNDARCTCEIKSRIAMTEAAFNKKKTVHLDWSCEEWRSIT